MKRILFILTIFVSVASYGQNIHVPFIQQQAPIQQIYGNGSTLYPYLLNSTFNSNYSDTSYGNIINSYTNSYIGQSYNASPSLTDVFYGDSWTAASTYGGDTTIGFAWIIAKADNALILNRGQAGTKLVYFSPGDSSMQNRIYTIPVYNPSVYHLLFFQYGTNDAGTYATPGDSTAFKTAYKQVLDSATIGRGWPLANIVIMVDGYYTKYNVDTTNIRIATASFARSYGVAYVDMYHAMCKYQPINVTVYTGDSLHPNPFGHRVIAQAAMDTMVRRLKLALRGNQTIYGSQNIYGNDTLHSLTNFMGPTIFNGTSNTIYSQAQSTPALTIAAPHMSGSGQYFESTRFLPSPADTQRDTFSIRRIFQSPGWDWALYHNSAKSIYITSADIYTFGATASYTSTPTFGFNGSMEANGNSVLNQPTGGNTYNLLLNGAGYAAGGLGQYSGIKFAGSGSTDIFTMQYQIQSGYNNPLVFGNKNGAVFTMNSGAATNPFQFNTVNTLFAASTTSGAAFNVPSGTAPSVPNNGDFWQASNHFYGRLNGSTYQLDQQATGSGTPGGNNNDLQIKEGANFWASDNLAFDTTNFGLKLLNPSMGGSLTNFNTGYYLGNTTAAAAGVQQISPPITWEGQGWKTTSTAASQSVKYEAHVLPVQGTTNPSANWVLSSSINGGSYGSPMTYTSGGILIVPAAPGGFATAGGALRLGINSATSDYLNMTTASVYGTGDLFFQGNPSNSLGYTVLENANSTAGMVVGSVGATPIKFAPNRTVKAILFSSGNMAIGSTSDGSNGVLQVTGDLTLESAGNALRITEGSNGRVGQTSLTSGTKAITITGLTTNSRAFVQLVSPSGATLTVQYQAVCTSNTLTIQANLASTSINTADGSTMNYFVIN